MIVSRKKREQGQTQVQTGTAALTRRFVGGDTNYSILSVEDEEKSNHEYLVSQGWRKTGFGKWMCPKGYLSPPIDMEAAVFEAYFQQLVQDGWTAFILEVEDEVELTIDQYAYFIHPTVKKCLSFYEAITLIRDFKGDEKGIENFVSPRTVEVNIMFTAQNLTVRRDEILRVRSEYSKKKLRNEFFFKSLSTAPVGG